MYTDEASTEISLNISSNRPCNLEHIGLKMRGNCAVQKLGLRLTVIELLHTVGCSDSTLTKGEIHEMLSCRSHVTWSCLEQAILV